MRHLGSLLLTILFAPATYVLAGVGLVKFTAATDPNDPAGRLTMAGAAGALVAAGILYAILAVSRMSPLGPFLAGLVFAGVSAWSLLAHPSFTGRVPHSILGMHGVLVRPAEIAALLAVPLIATAFNPSRWHREADEDVAGDLPYSAYQQPDPFQPDASPYRSDTSYQTGTLPQTYEEPFRGYR